MMLGLELPGKRSKGKPKRRFVDLMKENMVVIVSEED